MLFGSTSRSFGTVSIFPSIPIATYRITHFLRKVVQVQMPGESTCRRRASIPPSSGAPVQRRPSSCRWGINPDRQGSGGGQYVHFNRHPSYLCSSGMFAYVVMPGANPKEVSSMININDIELTADEEEIAKIEKVFRAVEAQLRKMLNGMKKDPAEVTGVLQV